MARLKQQSFLFFSFYQTQRSYEKIMCICLLFYWFSGENGIIRSSHCKIHRKTLVPECLFYKFAGADDFFTYLNL